MSEIQSRPSEEVLTLAEAAAFLRVPEAELLRLVETHDIPAQQIGSEWRFSRKALADWLRYGCDYLRERGSKQAILKHFGIFKDDDDLEERLAGIHARRKAAGG